MIEFKRPEQRESHWNEASTALTVNMIRFYGYMVRINGVVQNVNTNQFVKEFKKARMWDKLSD